MTNLTQAVEAVLAGSTINEQARIAGTHPETLRRQLLKHPGYAAAKAAGKLTKRGLPGVEPMSPEQKLRVRQAVQMVLSGSSMTDAAAEYDVSPMTLSRAVKSEHPNFDFRIRPQLGMVEAVREEVRLAQGALEKAIERLEQVTRYQEKQKEEA